MADSTNLSWKEKYEALLRVGKFRPLFTVAIISLGAFVALLEGVGLGFIYPILEIAQTGESINEGGSPVLEAFLSIYQYLGIPFELGYLILGVAAVISTRYTLSFVVGWLRAILSKKFEKNLRTRAFRNALDAKISYFDQKSSDDILNAIITETRYSGNVIVSSVRSLETAFLVLAYLSVMVYITPEMTALAIVLLGGITLLLRVIIEPAVTVGNRVATANEQVQETVQIGTQGIRDVKLFQMTEEVFDKFTQSIDQYTRSEIDLARNETAINNFYQLSAALTLFALIYVGFVSSGLSLGELGIFLIAMFQIAPRVSRLNSHIYNLEGHISHLVRTQQFLDDLSNNQETDGDKSVSSVSHIEFDNVSFSYTDNETVLDNLSFEIERGEFIAFAGQSGAGKSTIISLLARMYDPDEGTIRADGTPIDEYNLKQWRDRIAIVRQQPYIFNATLEENITIGNRDATRAEVERVCEIGKVDEFLPELPNGYESVLGDDGVRLSGGQRQRISLARAILKDADFLVLDEATSDLDSDLEREVQSQIESMSQDYGTIAIAHRLSTVKNADRIYTVEDGQIIETGSHQDLIEDNGKYADLYEIQSQE